MASSFFSIPDIYFGEDAQQYHLSVLVLTLNQRENL